MRLRRAQDRFYAKTDSLRKWVLNEEQRDELNLDISVFAAF